MSVSNATYYSEAELAEFKNLIEGKLENAKSQLNSLEDKVNSVSEASGNDGDRMDDSSNLQDLDMLYVMIGRQRKHIQDLENALIRVINKRYGVCVVTGELIDKRRLMAVPTTTKSIAGKNASSLKPVIDKPEKKKTKSSSALTSFSRVIKRTGGLPSTPIKKEDNFDDDLETDYDEVEGMEIDEIGNEYIEE